jgi:hypothetical protein
LADEEFHVEKGHTNFMRRRRRRRRRKRDAVAKIKNYKNYF